MTRLSPDLREWVRDPESRKIAGVCAGVAEALGVSVTAVRAGFVLLTLFHGIAVPLYLVLWFLMPDRPGGGSGLDRIVDVLAGVVGPPAGERARRRTAGRELDELEDPAELR